MCLSTAGNLPYWYINGKSYIRTNNTHTHTASSGCCSQYGYPVLGTEMTGTLHLFSSPSISWWDERLAIHLPREPPYPGKQSRTSLDEKKAWIGDRKHETIHFNLVVAYYIWCDIIHLRVVTLVPLQKSPSPVGLNDLGRIWSFLVYNAWTKWQRVRLELASNLSMGSCCRTEYSVTILYGKYKNELHVGMYVIRR